MLRRCSGFAAVLAALVVADPAVAGTLDQEQPTWGTADLVVGGVQEEVAQTFASTRNGYLDRVELALTDLNTYVPLRVAIRRTDETGIPTDELGAEEIPALAEDGPIALRSIAFDPPVYVQAGHRYAIVTSTGQDYRQAWIWGGASDDPYAFGSAFSRSGLLGSWRALTDVDLAFRTFVAPGPRCVVVRAVVNGRVICG